jgi:uncharacterized protein (TIGR03086 family)
MEIHDMMAAAGAVAVRVARGVRPDQLDAPTPCPDWDVRTLVNHLVLWSAFRSEAAARKQPTDETYTEDTDFTQGDWAETFAAQLDRATAAWAEPGATDGETGLAGGSMPATVIAAMMLGELVVHGWDLATATGQELAVDPEVLAAVREFGDTMGPMARQMGAFGAEVSVPDTAPPLDQVLGLVGRDPHWAASLAK